MRRRVVNAFLGLGFVSTLGGFAGAALAYLWPGASGASGSNLLMGKDGPLSAATLAQDEGVVGRSNLGKVLVIRRGERLVGYRPPAPISAASWRGIPPRSRLSAPVTVLAMTCRAGCCEGRRESPWPSYR